jgi:hypothetical protein
MVQTPIVETHWIFAKTRKWLGPPIQPLDTHPHASHLDLAIEFVRDSRTETRGSGSCQRNRQERARRLLRSSCLAQASLYAAVLHVRRIAFPHQILLPRLASAGTTGWITQLSKNVGIPARPVRRLSVPRHPRIRRLTPQGQTEQQRLLQRPQSTASPLRRHRRANPLP